MLVAKELEPHNLAAHSSRSLGQAHSNQELLHNLKLHSPVVHAASISLRAPSRSARRRAKPEIPIISTLTMTLNVWIRREPRVDKQQDADEVSATVTRAETLNFEKGKNLPIQNLPEEQIFRRGHHDRPWQDLVNYRNRASRLLLIRTCIH